MKVRVEIFDTISYISSGLSAIQSRVLLLNRSYFPIHITTVRRAVNLLALDLAEGVDAEYRTYQWEELLKGAPDEARDEDFHLVRTISRMIAIPKVVILKEFDGRPPQNIRFSRLQVFLRDQHRCQYCGQHFPKQRLNIDHVIPRIQGGRTTWDNVVTSCHPCNRRKGGRTPSQAGMPLLSIPAKPRVSPMLLMLREVHPSWSAFLTPIG